MPDVVRTVVITGASSGIGLAGAEALAAAGHEVVLVGRHPGRLARAVGRVTRAADRGGRTAGRGVRTTPVRAYRADFAILDEVRRLGERLNAELESVDVLVNNAGMLAPWTRRTVDGHDVTIQVNHLAGFLLSHLLLDKLRHSARSGEPARVVTTGSLAEAWGWLDVDRPAAPQWRYRSRWLAYGASKQANALFTVEAGRRWAPDGVVATCFFPGLVQTRFARTSLLFTMARPVPLVVQPPAVAADTLVWLATAPEALVPGGYFAFRQPFVATPRATRPDRAARLWRSSLAAVGLPDDDAP
jgi:NAD(P)-dependent dehydrogenase (short-subunit alcohol dehydrogenase family)